MQTALPIHVALIMDGNGRWATSRGLPRTAGHHAGVRAARKIVEAAGRSGIRNLTLYAFSSDNWKRPPEEVGALFRLLERRLPVEVESCIENHIRISIVGRRDRLPQRLVDTITKAEEQTTAENRMHVRLAIDYSCRDAIVEAARRTTADQTREDFARNLAQAYSSGPVPDVDLLIRTGGECRLSDFLLWECAYAELYFTDRLFPEFSPDDFQDALTWYATRERRFGAAPEEQSGHSPVSRQHHRLSRQEANPALG